MKDVFSLILDIIPLFVQTKIIWYLLVTPPISLFALSFQSNKTLQQA